MRSCCQPLQPSHQWLLTGYSSDDSTQHQPPPSSPPPSSPHVFNPNAVRYCNRSSSPVDLTHTCKSHQSQDWWLELAEEARLSLGRRPPPQDRPRSPVRTASPQQDRPRSPVRTAWSPEKGAVPADRSEVQPIRGDSSGGWRRAKNRASRVVSPLRDSRPAEINTSPPRSRPTSPAKGKDKWWAGIGRSSRGQSVLRDDRLQELETQLQEATNEWDFVKAKEIERQLKSLKASSI